MMTKSKRFLMLMLTLVVSVAGYAQTEIDGIKYNLNSKTKEAEVTYGKNSEKVTIPSNVTYDGVKYKVTSIGERAFFIFDNLVSVKIPSSVTSIGEEAFSHCSGLTSITIPNSVTSIGQKAFDSCSKLTSITIPNTLTSIEEKTFLDCRGLTSVTIPNSVTSIGEEAFTGCSGLTSITIPNSVKSIGALAFAQCSALISVTFPNSVTSIGDYAFNWCNSLTSVTIPSSVKSIGKGAFNGFAALASVTNFSKTPQKIDVTVFGVYGTLHVLPGCKAAYEAADFWKNFTIVEDAVTTGIADIETRNSNKEGKYIENGKIVIVKNGKEYNMNGQAK
ncbi:MAG: leucine-rich repeat domain-containing protein [Prevotella sp.]|nr:leucine-rich repeat domain-containing protein [Prevotella sp.]